MDDFVGTLTNTLLGIGQSRDRIAATDVRRGSLLGRDQRSELYAHNSLFRKIVNVPPDDAVRRGWDYLFENGDLTQQVEDFFEAFELESALNWTDKLSRLHGGGGLILVVRPDSALDQPLDLTRVRELITIHAASAEELKTRTIDTDIESKGFGKPLLYDWRVGTETEVVHRDRVIRFEGLQVDERYSRTVRQGWGADIINLVWEKVRNYDVSMHGVATTVGEFHYTVYGVDNLADLLASGPGPDGKTGKQVLLDRLQAIDLSRSIHNTFLIDNQNESLTRLGAPVRGLEALVDKLMVAVAEAADMPITKLWGQAPSGLSTDDASGTRNWNEKISRRQKTRYLGPIRRLVDLFLATIGQSEAAYKVEFRSLTDLDPLQQATLRESQARTDKSNIDAGVLKTWEVRDSRFGGPGYSTDTRLDPTVDLQAEQEEAKLAMQEQFDSDEKPDDDEPDDESDDQEDPNKEEDD